MNTAQKLKKYYINNISPRPTNTIKDMQDYAHGKTFTDGVILDVKNLPLIDERESYIKKLVKGKKVLHVGCCDHVPLIEDKIEKGLWLHKILEENADRVIGVDIDVEAIKFIQEKIGSKNVYADDITNPVNKIFQEEKFDYMILGEIIEHVDNPYEILSKIHKLYKDNIKQIIITTPNSNSYYNYFYSKHNLENINSDHRFIFNIYTMTKCMIRAGFKIDSANFLYSTYKTWHKVINRTIGKNIFRNKKAFANNMLIIGDF